MWVCVKGVWIECVEGVCGCVWEGVCGRRCV